MTLPTQDKPSRRTFLVADLKCYLCGGVAGCIEAEQAVPQARASGFPRAVAFRKPGSDDPVPVADWRQIRCLRCGGPTFLDETDLVVRRSEAYDWLAERPRRGRPPKRLVEERRRQQELVESQAA